jgi:hypothetical protein
MLSYNVGIWMFAMRYWSLSIILETTLQKMNPEDQEMLVLVVTFGGLFITVFASILLPLLVFYGEHFRGMGVGSALLWCSSFAFLFSALRRIRRVMTTLTDVVIIYEAFMMYAVAGFFAIIGLVVIIGIDFKKEPAPDAYIWATIVSNITVFIF